jgi:hypothetical protein
MKSHLQIFLSVFVHTTTTTTTTTKRYGLPFQQRQGEKKSSVLRMDYQINSLVVEILQARKLLSTVIVSLRHCNSDSNRETI